MSATQINAAQKILDDYVTSENLKTKKILIVHQFGDPAVQDGVPFMIREKKTVKNFQNVELVIDADGLGSPLIKLRKYNLMPDCNVYPFVLFRGIKIFFPNKLGAPPAFRYTAHDCRPDLRGEAGARRPASCKQAERGHHYLIK